MKAQGMKAEDILERLQLASRESPSQTDRLAQCQSLVYQLRQAVRNKEFRRDYCFDLDAYGRQLLWQASQILNALLRNQRGRAG